MRDKNRDEIDCQQYTDVRWKGLCIQHALLSMQESDDNVGDFS